MGWRSMVGVRDDGTLWIWNYTPRQQVDYSPEGSLAAPHQMGTESDWRMVAAAHAARITVLKADGSLWQFVSGKPVRVSSYNDWVAIDTFGEGYGNGFRALAADGSIWFWVDWNTSLNYYGPTALVPSRKPEFIGNIFAETK